MKKITAFTLIELLAVIVILAIIIVIAIPLVLGTVEKAKKGAMQSDALLIIDTIKKKKIVDDTFTYTDITEATIEEKLGIKPTNYFSLKVDDVDGQPVVTIVGQNRYDGYTAEGTYENVIVVASEDYTPPQIDYIVSEGINKPRLAQGMTAIKWNNGTNKWEKVENPDTDTSWYDYTNKEWANAVTSDCTNPSDYLTCSMWVWIPRYAYQIASGYHTNTTGTINIKFLKNLTNIASDNNTVDTIPTYSGSSQTNYIKHPAFTFGSDELSGIWIAKFEASVSNTSDSCYTNENLTNCNITTLTPKIVPNVHSWKFISVGNIFTVLRSMETKSVYGWELASDLNTDGTFTTDNNNIDTHLIKNIEWGAVAYLSKSTYGKDQEIYSNNSSTQTTGCSGGSTNPIFYSGCQYAYNTPNGQGASTTGTIYGVYDMSGGANEFTSSYVNNGSTYLTNFGLSIINASDKYKDIYETGSPDTQTNNYALTINKKGDALYETSSNHTFDNSWFQDGSYMASFFSPWILRSGTYYGSSSGVFAFESRNGTGYDYDDYEGEYYSSYGFRPILVVHQ